MNQEPEIRAVIDRYCDAVLAGDIDTALDCYAEDIVLHWHGRHALAGAHRGKDAAVAALIAFAQCTERKFINFPARMHGPTRGAIISREALGKGDARVEVERVLVYAVRDGRFTECWVYDADQELIERLVGP
jgi:uncharacterized protein